MKAAAVHWIAVVHVTIITNGWKNNEKGELICSTGIVVLKNSKDGKVYALNGMANALADSGRKLGKSPILNNKAVTKPDPQVAGYQMSTVDIMMEGLDLCN